MTVQGGQIDPRELDYSDVPLHIGNFLSDWLDNNDSTLSDLADEMVGDFGRNLFILELLCCNRDPQVRMPRDFAERLGFATGMSAGFWLGIDLSCRHSWVRPEAMMRTADCDCIACKSQPADEHYVNGKLKATP